MAAQFAECDPRLAAAGTIRSMLAHAPVFTPKHSLIKSISFHGPEFDPVEYVG